ncbi:MAG: N-acetyl-gamma-glutamyl-phosphate reductase [Thermoplasmata archaeon]|jgi:N-acetyl-gamma-glutamyl-phosphate reductase|nr:N-acetyl-gamma-glutamyl-phosphate reductase [Candidatus Sysuiplasma jiujiangense]MBX8639833.1 N-acetyl-gamma-glutamyl-phosphate reductase [Candidatus Sysuiplasma jiujiangense]MBX8642365.1 N-acetyl-gamma-glutamyl-phosphate reductase [Candidatus Sysuiplasma jiujiangense]
MSDEKKAGIIGAGGYAGYELLRIMDGHPGFEIAYAQSDSMAGRKLSAVYPWMKHDGVVVSGKSDFRSVSDCDIVFISLPAGESMKIVPQLIDSGLRIVDLGPDYRLHDTSSFERYYGMKHMDQKNLENSVYGLTEAMSRRISEASLVANPGCYSTAALIALLPVADMIGGDVVIDAKSGTSGAGKEPTFPTHHPDIAENIRPYNVNNHRHIAEINEMLSVYGKCLSPVFVPHLIPIVRGIEETIYLFDTSASSVTEKLSSYYRDSKFVHIGSNCSLNMVNSSNHCMIEIIEAGMNTILMVFIDNLVKGASGQAVQNANIMMSFPEDAGLKFGPSGVGR